VREYQRKERGDNYDNQDDDAVYVGDIIELVKTIDI